MTFAVATQGMPLQLSAAESQADRQALEAKQQEIQLEEEKDAYLVLVKEEEDVESIQQTYEKAAEYDTMQNGNVVLAQMTPEEAEELEESPDVVAVEENIILTGLQEDQEILQEESQEEPFAEEVYQWNLDAIQLAAPEQTDEKPVKIEILDSGVSYTDEIEMEERVNLIPGEEEVLALYDDSNGHGTAIAGMIGAKDNGEGITGINPNAQLYSVKVLDSTLKSPLSRIVEGIYWGIEHDMDIIHMSFGTRTDSQILRKAIQDASDAGITLVAAAGNTPDAGVHYPAAYPGVIAVGSSSASGELAEHTSVGKELDLIAPGEQVVTTGLFSGVLLTSGTSIAAAQVTGAASLLMGYGTRRDADFIQQLLCQSAKDMKMEEVDAGLLDCEYAFAIYDEFVNTYESGAAVETGNPAAIGDFTDDAEEVVEGLWGNSDKDGNESHYWASNWAGKQMNISGNNLTILSTMAAKIDTNYKEIWALHARGNYVANLMFLWKLSQEVANASNTTQNAVQKAYNSVMETTTMTGTGKSLLNELKQELQKTDKGSFFVKNFSGVNESSREAMKYKVLGMAMHLIGDTCAHRTVVPSNAELENTTEAKKFYRSDFGTSTNVPSTADLKLWLRNSVQQEYEEKLKPYRNWVTLEAAVRTGCLEFRDIRRLMPSRGNKYEDKPDFYPVRYTITKYASRRLLQATSLKESRRVMVPVSNYIVFNNLKGYFVDTGGSSGYINYWDQVSTSSFI